MQFIFRLAGVFCRMQNGLYSQRYQCEARPDACSLRSEIDKDMTVLLGFQVYKSENNKVKLNKSRLPRLI